MSVSNRQPRHDVIRSDSVEYANLVEVHGKLFGVAMENLFLGVRQSSVRNEHLSALQQLQDIKKTLETCSLKIASFQNAGVMSIFMGQVNLLSRRVMILEKEMCQKIVERVKQLIDELSETGVENELEKLTSIEADITAILRRHQPSAAFFSKNCAKAGSEDCLTLQRLLEEVIQLKNGCQEKLAVSMDNLAQAKKLVTCVSDIPHPIGVVLKLMDRHIRKASQSIEQFEQTLDLEYKPKANQFMAKVEDTVVKEEPKFTFPPPASGRREWKG